jgi:hypothetical protein
MSFDFLNKENTEAYLLGSLYYRAGDSSDIVVSKKLPRALRWYQMILSGTALRGDTRRNFLKKSQLLFCFVYDIGYLLLEGARYFEFRLDLGAIDPDLITMYSRGVVERLLRDESFVEAAAWLSGDPSQDDLIAWLIGKALDSILQARPIYAFSITPSTTKNLRAEYSFLDYGTLFDEIRAPQELSLKRAIIHMANIHKQRSTRPIFSGDTLETVKYWKTFKNRFAWEAGQRILHWLDIFPEFDPRRMHVVREEQLETKMPQVGPYPTGGYAGISSKGRIESLLPSELIYMDIVPFDEGDASLFDIKYVLDELLYLEREGGQMTRIKRVLHIAIDPSKHRLPLAQGIYSLYAIYGLLVSLIRNLITALPKSLEVHLHILKHAQSDNKWIQVELAILETLLEQEIMYGYVTITTPKKIDLHSLEEEDAQVYGISVYGGEGMPPGIDEEELDTPQMRGDPKIKVWQIFGSDAAPTSLSIPWPDEAAELKEYFSDKLNVAHSWFLKWILGAP